MKLPNFRLYETQATASVILGVFCILCVLLLVGFVFRGFDTELKTISYDPRGGLGQFRKPLVYVTTVAVVGSGAVAGLLGFSSLGQRRNLKQGRSWLGMTLGALAVAVAPVLFFAWRLFSEPIIRDRG